MSDASMPHCEKCNQPEYACLCDVDQDAIDNPYEAFLRDLKDRGLILDYEMTGDGLAEIELAHVPGHIDLRVRPATSKTVGDAIERLKAHGAVAKPCHGRPPIRVPLHGTKDPDPLAPAPGPINPETGQHTDYWVLSDEERAKGHVRPVRDSYIHTKCGVKTTMGHKIAETYARDPKFYGSTFCCGCKEHFPVGEFTWDGTDEIVGS